MLAEFDLSGKVAVVASGGQSAAVELIRYLHAADAKIAVIAGPEKAGEIADELPAGTALCIPTDVTRETEVLKAMDRTFAEFGKIDILVNSFNEELWKPVLDVTEKEWRQAMQANATSVFLTCKAAAHYMTAQRSGSIVNMISALAERGIPAGAVYCAAMGAVLEMTRAMAIEWAPMNVRVNAVGAGWRERPAGATGKDIMARYIPAQRRMRAGDILPMVRFLASDAASFISGCLYTVDGGLMARA